MLTIKVSATGSTNSLIKEIHRKGVFRENLCVVARNQTKGRGQRGSGWVSEPGKNLTFSLLFRNLELPAEQHFKLNAGIGLALVGVLEKVEIENPRIKWPNDILSGNRKIAGVLVENSLKQGKIRESVIGVGLNVNQVNFPGLPQACSLKSVKGKEFDLEGLLKKLLPEIESALANLKKQSMESVLEEYHQYLFRIGEDSVFELPSGERFPGTIKGVTEEGRLQVEAEKPAPGEAGENREFMVKEVKLLF